MHTIKRILFAFLILTFPTSVLAKNEDDMKNAPKELHKPLDELLKTYVRGFGVKYAEWTRNKADVEKFQKYIETLESQKPENWKRADALAFWINLYNAATLRLILENYPVKSIKDLGNFFLTPWKKKVVTVSGKELTLDQIENEIIRAEFEDARIHFALNCGSIGCPPLAKEAFLAEKLDQQLEAVTKKTLTSRRYVRIEEDVVSVSQIFDWYEEDFVKAAGSVHAFLARYLPDQKEVLLKEKRTIKSMDYDWNLNETSAAN